MMCLINPENTTVASLFNLSSLPPSLPQVPDYLQVIKFPMDFGTMRKKVDSHEYFTMDEFEHDFDLVWKNATVYNEKETIYYRAGTRIRDAGVKILMAARGQLKGAGVNEDTGAHEPEVLEPEPLTSVTTTGTDELPDVFDESRWCGYVICSYLCEYMFMYMMCDVFL